MTFRMVLQPWKSFYSKNLMGIAQFLPLLIILTATLSIQVTAIKRNVIHSRNYITKDFIESSLETIHEIATEKLGTKCASKAFHTLQVPLNTARYEGTRQKADLATIILQDFGVYTHAGLWDAIAKGLLNDEFISSARVLVVNITNGALISSVWWNKNIAGLSEPNRINEAGIQVGFEPDKDYPWYESEITSSSRSPKFIPSPESSAYRGWWTYPYYSCKQQCWLLSYSIAIPPKHGMKGFLSIDIDVSELQVNQCSSPRSKEPLSANKYYTEIFTQIEIFHDSNRCHSHSMSCEYRPPYGRNTVWIRGAYQCLCKPGFYSVRHRDGFNGTVMEVAYKEFRDNKSTYYEDVFRCTRCAEGCVTCSDGTPCLASYNWAFRISLLTVSIMCAVFTIVLSCYLYHHRKVKVFKVASPIFLTITLVGCAIMYLEMAAIFPFLDMTSCTATKWTRHMGFCITYTALLMKTWRVSLTYRVKSAHKVKLTDKQLLQWMVPILLVMLIYLGTWTLSATPNAEVIVDSNGLKFKQCIYNWWDHSLAIGEVLFLAWGIRVCYNVRNAESLYNEARMISYAIYNIALVNILMIAFHLIIFPQAGPDVKYFLGFVRTQLSTTTTVVLVFAPKVLRVLRGQGDQWDHRARVRGITASFSLNGIGLVPEDSPDLYQENEELKEEIQKLAAQIEFQKIVNMSTNNRHIKPKPGSYFSSASSIQSPTSKTIAAQTQTTKYPREQASGISEDGHSGHSGTNSVGKNSTG
ncbi:probable G-protein coupled receptor CG31760 isoform X2 [Contarinia nasturtii]|uniref:probable G-protein coupled receptor CG31760 isoform X2 n=1 Tax=Contarinia nasturtii TaxID=265458 RepID=UPI0012D3FF0F|nr:probable G-protein coupled receptor CG31760 isoform X2 [Contarinia nasturtii]